MAPTGQWAEHWPQRIQGLSPSLTSAAGAILVDSPRPRNSMAQTFCICWQTVTQRPQRTHFSGLRMIEPVVSSRGRSLSRLGKLCSRIPDSWARVCSSQSWLRGQARQSSGWVESMSSMTVLRISTSSASLVIKLCPSITGVQQDLSILLPPSTLTTQIPQAAQGERSGL